MVLECLEMESEPLARRPWVVEHPAWAPLAAVPLPNVTLALPWVDATLRLDCVPYLLPTRCVLLPFLT